MVKVPLFNRLPPATCGSHSDVVPVLEFIPEFIPELLGVVLLDFFPGFFLDFFPDLLSVPDFFFGLIECSGFFYGFFFGLIGRFFCSDQF